ncbi:hypothetical protein ECANGB1_1179 [Enterospora canceri]|uniref:Uncharacterized protein n=1 Tax=Enterospora canceri TaxID=1081671 RepID=A0A1Y1S7E4_9MICR|nr:hypothetical protein ECANGB1_1179 [Enterospora canceri]
MHLIFLVIQQIYSSKNIFNEYASDINQEESSIIAIKQGNDFIACPFPFTKVVVSPSLTSSDVFEYSSIEKLTADNIETQVRNSAEFKRLNRLTNPDDFTTDLDKPFYRETISKIEIDKKSAGQSAPLVDLIITRLSEAQFDPSENKPTRFDTSKFKISDKMVLSVDKIHKKLNDSIKFDKNVFYAYCEALDSKEMKSRITPLFIVKIKDTTLRFEPLSLSKRSRSVTPPLSNNMHLTVLVMTLLVLIISLAVLVIGVIHTFRNIQKCERVEERPVEERTIIERTIIEPNQPDQSNQQTEPNQQSEPVESDTPSN